MAEDIGQTFRQFGADVSNAFTGPAQMRLKMAMTKHELDQENEAKAKKEITSEAVGKKYGDTAKAFFDSGDISTYTSLRELDMKAAKGSGGGGGGGGGAGGKFLEQYHLANQVTEELAAKQEAAQKLVIEARESGDYAKVSAAMDQFNALQNVSMKVKESVLSMTTEGRSELSDALNQKIDGLMAGFDPAKMLAIEQATKESISTSNKVPKNIITMLDDSKVKYGIDISGIASDTSIRKFIDTATGSGKMSIKDAAVIQHTTDLKVLSEIANSEAVPEAVRMSAAAQYTRLLVASKMDNGIAQEMQAATDKGLADMAFGEGRTLEEKSRGAIARDELMGRKKEQFSKDSIKENEVNKKSIGRKVGFKSVDQKAADFESGVKKARSEIAKNQKIVDKYSKPKNVSEKGALDAAKKRIQQAEEALKGYGIE